MLRAIYETDYTLAVKNAKGIKIAYVDVLVSADCEKIMTADFIANYQHSIENAFIKAVNGEMKYQPSKRLSISNVGNFVKMY